MELRKRKQPEDTHGNSNTDNGVGDENHNSIQTDEYTNCTHGDLADYTCVECLYNRWRSQANFKKPPPPVKSDSVIVIDDDVPDQLHGVHMEKITEKVKNIFSENYSLIYTMEDKILGTNGFWLVKYSICEQFL